MSDAEAEMTPSTSAGPENEAPVGDVAASVVSFGALLVAAREAQGLSQVDLAGRLRLHPRQIAALEEERLDQLPSPPFIRGYVRNYAKELKVDPAPVLAALAQRLPATRAADDQAPLTGVSAAEVRSAGVEHASRLAVVGGTVAVLVVLGLIGWIASERLSSPPPAVQATSPSPTTTGAAGAAVTTPATPAEGGAPAPAQTNEVRPEAVGAAPTGDAAAPSGDNRSIAGGASPVAADVTPAPASGPANAPPASSTPFVAGLRIVVGDRPSWVEVTSADGRVALTGLQEAGTERRIGNLQAPVRLVIGNASTVTLEYRGKPVDLKSAIRANDLARLTLE